MLMMMKMISLLQQLNLHLMLVAVLMTNCNGQETLACGPNSFNTTTGNITSPNYPLNYDNLEDCQTAIFAPTLSTITLTFNSFQVEYEITCNYDYLEVSCSNLNSRPARFCGLTIPSQLTFTPCSQVVLHFHSDLSINYVGFSLTYQVSSIQCIGNCNANISPTGYTCPCDSNQTIASPNSSCSAGCSPSTGGDFCYCPVLLTTTSATCAPGCSISYDFFNDQICNCGTTAASVTCSPGCYSTTDYYGNPYCNCPTATVPLSCGFGCYVAYDYWGNQYCNCVSSTTPTLWCSFGCFRTTDFYGNPYCSCPTTTPRLCNSPCYWTTDSTVYPYAQTCYCPPTTTNPPPTGCNQTFSSLSATVTSPNYPNAYTKGYDCYQYITLPSAASMQIQILALSIYYFSTYVCTYDYLQITGCDGSVQILCNPYSSSNLGYVYSFQCTNSPTTTILFHSSNNSSPYTTYTGFSLLYTANTRTNCSGGSGGIYLTSGTSGTITSPNYPSDFPLTSECNTFLFGDDPAIQTKFIFQEWSMPASATCSTVFIQFTCQDGSGYSRTVCANAYPSPLIFNCETIQITFKSSDTSLSSPRFYKLLYSAIIPMSQTEMVNSVTDLPVGTKLGIGLGVGIGGFFLLVLIILIAFLIVTGRRSSARRERRHLEDLAIICRNINATGTGVQQGGNVRITRGAPENLEFVNLSTEGGAAYPPSYRSDLFVAEEPKTPLVEQ